MPHEISLEKNKNYAYCNCGKSKTIPLCDGSHKGSGTSPTLFKATETKKMYLCNCGLSKEKPYCDGSHKG